MCKDEFNEGNGWQEQLYIREARRMVSDFVMTQNHCQQRETVDDSVGMGAYTMDSHNVQRYITADGFAKNEGDVQVGGFPPYPISFRSIIPRKSEAENLLVPVCLSASHMAFGSIRMEPVFMVLGQSAATAASFAIREDSPVQEVDYAELRKRLKADGQVLFHGVYQELDGIIVDDTKAELKGAWKRTVLHAGYRNSYVHDSDARDGKSQATFQAKLPSPGQYEVQIAYTTNSNRATNVSVTIEHRDGTAKLKVNQQKKPSLEIGFHSLGTFAFSKTGSVMISNEGTDGHVIADAVRWLSVAE
jgi:hypothetical protein